jgi:4-carboxymuconolactone decarboxylase
MDNTLDFPDVRELLGDVAPKLVDLTEQVLFGDVWEEQLPYHFTRALENGISSKELIEVITHLAFYSGWPTAIAAGIEAKKVFNEKGEQ